MNEEKQEERKEQENSYEFLKETIKEKPVDKKKLARKVGNLVGSGIVFGTTAALVFSASIPGLIKKAEERRRSEEIRFASQKAKEEKKEAEKTSLQSQQDGAQAAVVPMQELTPTEYRKLYTEIFSVADQVKDAMVTVIGSKHNKDWFESPYEKEISGVIIAENEQDFFVLTEYRIVEDVDRIQVVFCDGSTTDARFHRADLNTGLAVLKISKADISGTTKERIAIASLGDAYDIKQGEPVLAIGSPMGYSDSVGYGIVTSASHKVSKIDAEYGILATDIAGSSNGSGVLLNLEGEIVGIISQSFAREDTDTLVTGLSVSYMKELIQTLTDEEKELIYVGITGENITPDISEKKGIPVGVFVEKTEVDSPAMLVGIQSGDVIVEVKNEKVETVREYQRLLKECRAGETIKIKAMRQGAEAYVEVDFDVPLGTR